MGKEREKILLSNSEHLKQYPLSERQGNLVKSPRISSVIDILIDRCTPKAFSSMACINKTHKIHNATAEFSK